MKRLIPFKLGISLALILLLGAAAWADIETADVESGYFKHEFELGYRVFNDKDNALRAREYDFNHSNATGSAEISVVEDWGHLNLDGSYLNEKDFDASAHIEAGSILRLDLNTTSLFHNLDHIDYENRPDAWEWSDTTQTPPQPLNPAGYTLADPERPTVQFSDSDPTAIYGIKTQISEAKARLKMGDYPAHLNLNYWSLERSGQRQQRYLAENCSGCHVQSTSRPVDQIVEEFKASVDAHVGPVDVIVEQTFRQFDNRNPAPVDFFDLHFRQRTPGDYEHDDEPDQRYRATTLKLHTSLAGGLIAGASGTIGKRENESDVQDVAPIEAETDFVKAAGDLTWIPSGRITLNTRYRYLDLEFDNSDQVVATGSQSGNPIDIRNSIDQTVHNAVAALSWRPIKSWQVKAEGEWREIDREIADPQTGTDLWDVPEDETRTRYKLALYGRTLSNHALKLRSWLQYSDSSDPAYGASFDEKKTAFVGLGYSPSTRWGIGLNAKYEISEQENHLTVIEEGTPGELRFERDREQDSAIITAMAWNRPTKSLEIGLHYGYLDTHVSQDVIFGTDTVGSPPAFTPFVPDFVVPAEDAEYDQSVHNASIQFNWRCRKAWTTRAEGRLILSRSEFDPDFADELLNFDSGAFPATATATGLSEISKTDIRQYGASAGIDWEPTDTVRCGVTYTWDKYDDRQNEALDGTVQTYMASLSKAW